MGSWISAQTARENEFARCRWPSMKIDIVPLVVLVFCVGVAASALLSTGNSDQIEAPLAVAQVQK